MRHFRPCPHVAAGIFENGDFFCVFKKICVHTQRFRIVCAEERALNLGMTSSYLKTSVFARLHEYVASNAAALFPFRGREPAAKEIRRLHSRLQEYDECPFSKISTVESVLENLRFRCPKTPITCDGSRIRRKKSPFSKIPGYVWTGSYS